MGVTTLPAGRAATGSRAGDEVVQVYVGYPRSKVDRLLEPLRGFQQAALAPGETRAVALRGGAPRAIRTPDLQIRSLLDRSLESCTYDALSAWGFTGVADGIGPDSGDRVAPKYVATRHPPTTGRYTPSTISRLR